MTQPVFPSGINWLSVILGSVNIGFDPILGAGLIPEGTAGVTFDLVLGMMPPALFNMLFSPTVGTAVSTESSATVGILFEPTIGELGAQGPLGEFNIALTLTIGERGQLIEPAHPPRQINRVALLRAATI